MNYRKHSCLYAHSVCVVAKWEMCSGYFGDFNRRIRTFISLFEWVYAPEPESIQQFKWDQSSLEWAVPQNTLCSQTDNSKGLKPHMCDNTFSFHRAQCCDTAHGF